VKFEYITAVTPLGVMTTDDLGLPRSPKTLLVPAAGVLRRQASSYTLVKVPAVAGVMETAKLGERLMLFSIQ
jgi:hypothetical protein